MARTVLVVFALVLVAMTKVTALEQKELAVLFNDPIQPVSVTKYHDDPPMVVHQSTPSGSLRTHSNGVQGGAAAEPNTAGASSNGMSSATTTALADVAVNQATCLKEFFIEEELLFQPPSPSKLSPHLSDQFVSFCGWSCEDQMTTDL
jgi:hypothetical protein